MNSGINKFVSGFIILVVSLFACTDQPKDNESLKPNILWIIADDLGADMGCYGTALVKTPNLDKLAGQGAKYTNLFTVAVVCSPSRSSLITGMYPDNPLARQDWALYLENIQIVDRQIGEILKRLEEDGLLDSTVVFFFGDQGRPHVRARQFMYDGGIHTPLIIRLPREIRSQRNDEVIISWGWPGHITPGSVDNRLISNVDLPVTALKIAGIDPPDYIQGKDFLSPGAEKREAIFAMRDRRDETVDRIRCVRTEKYKYIRNFYPERPYTQFKDN